LITVFLENSREYKSKTTNPLSTVKDDAQKLLCALYSTTNCLFQMYMLDVLEYTSISSTLPEKQERELADRLVQFLEIESYPAQVEILRDIAKIRLTSRVGRSGDKHVV
jgi:hypothetical protein